MKSKTSRAGRTGWLAIAIATCSIGATAMPAEAQLTDSRLELNGRTFALSAQEQASLTDLGHTVTSANPGAQDRALAAARAIVNSVDARYVFAIYEFEIGRHRHDDSLQAEAIDVLITDTRAPRDRLASWLATGGNIAFRAHDYEKASAMWTRLIALQPGDPQMLFNLAQVRAAQNDGPGAIDLIRRAVAVRHDGPTPETWLRQWLSIAFNAHLVEEGEAAARALVTAYPTPTNWRDALVAYRQLAAPQAGAEIDLLRLMRTANALIRPAEYQRLAQLLLHAGFPGEARAVLDEGIARNVVNRTEQPTPAISAEIDRTIAQPRSHPPSPIPAGYVPPLGADRYAAAVAAFNAGHRAEAQAGFRDLAAHAEGQGAARWYPDLASFWLLWLARSG